MKTPSIATRALHRCTGCSSRRSRWRAAPGTRPPQTQEQLLQRREAMDQRLVTDGRGMFQQLLARVKGEYDAYSAGRATEPPKIDILIISGGGTGGVRRRLPQGLGPGPARPHGEASVRRRDGRQHGRPHRALRVPRRRAVDRHDRGAVPQPEKRLGQAALAAVFPPQQHVLRGGAGLGAGDAGDRHPGDGAAGRGGGRDGRILAVNTTNVDDASQRVWNLVRRRSARSRPTMWTASIASCSPPPASPGRSPSA